MRKGLLLVVSAPSGAGKTSLCRDVVQRVPDLRYSISYTTRSIRPTESNGKDYYFVTKEEFQDLVQRDEFAEWAEVHGHLYGTHERTLRETMDGGEDVILDVDGQGASSLKNRFPDGIFIYILPPSLSALKQRLYERRSDSENEIERRLSEARKELQRLGQYTYRIVNKDFQEASKELECILRAERLRLRSGEYSSIMDRLLNEEAIL